MDDLDQALAKIRGASLPDPDQALAKIRASKQPVEPADDTGYLGRVTTHVLNAAQGIPGMEALEAGVGALGSHVIGDRPLSYQESLNALREQTGKIGGKTAIAEKMMGSVATLPFLPSSAVGAGAALGAADQALAADPESLAARAGKTALGGAIGAGIGKAAGVAGNIAQRSGLTDLVGAGLRKVPVPGAQAVGEAIGTKGAANRLLASRQSLLDELSGSEKTAAQTMLDHVNAYKQQARTLYDAAKQDTKAVNDPRVQEALADPRVQQMFQMVKERLGLGTTADNTAAESVAGVRTGSGRIRSNITTADDAALADEIDRVQELQSRDAQTLAAHQEHPDYHDALELRSVGNKEDADGLVDPVLRSKLAMLRSQLDQRGKTLAKLEGELARRQGVMHAAEHGEAIGDATFGFGENTLPTPEEIAMTKRLLGSVVQGKFNAPQGISAAEAVQLAPKLDALRAALHDASPAWKQADQFYSQAKNFETAYTKAFGAQQKTTAGGLDPRKLKTTDAIDSWVGRADGTPTGIARASGQQAGAAGRLGDALRSAPLGTDMASTLQGANGVFQPSQAAAAIRRPAFGSDEAAQSFASQIGRASVPESFGTQDASLLKPWQFGQKQNPLATAKGTELRALVAAQLESDQRNGTNVIAKSLQQSQHGQKLLQLFQRAGFLGANASQPFR